MHRAGALDLPDRRHGFDLMRLAAALLVLVSHAYLLPTGRQPVPLPFADQALDWGRLGVIVFFVVSGYLVCGSWLGAPRLASFAARRVRRIYPALALMVLICALLVGPLATVSADYWGDGRVWEFIWRNLLVVPYRYGLPGVFDGKPVNGVLWTLGLEVIAYVAIALLGRARLLRSGVLLSFVTACALIGWPWLYWKGPTWFEPYGVRIGLLAYFFAGAWARRSGLDPTWRTAVAGLVVAVATAWSGLPLSVVAVPVLVPVIVFLCLRPAQWARGVVRLGDPSFGAYLYGYVIQRIMMAGGLEDAPRAVFVSVSVLAAALAGYASWHLWEKRFLRSRRVLPRSAPWTTRRAEGA